MERGHKVTHYIGDASFFASFFKKPLIENYFLFFSDILEFKIRLNKETVKNRTLFYVGDIADVGKVEFHKGFEEKIDYLFIYFTDKRKRKEIKEIFSPFTDYYSRHRYLFSLYKEIMNGEGSFFVYSPPEIIIRTDKNIVIKDLSYFSLFTRKSPFKSEDALIEKTTVSVKNPNKVFIGDNKENFIIKAVS